MSKLNKDVIVSLGGKVWVKDSISRVYMSLSVINALIKTEGYGEDFVKENKKTKAAKTFFDINSGSLISDNGTIRSSFNQTGFNCK